MDIRASKRRVAASLVGFAGLFGAAQADAASIFVNADITTSQTWTANNEYILTNRIYVKGGATLTIEAGVTVRGEPESVLNARDPGTLIITRGSKIRALGTKLHPIVFTDLDDDNLGANPGSSPYDNLADAQSLTGQWGGLILLSYGHVANNTLGAPNPAREIQIEGLVALGEEGFYGGCQEFLAGPYGRNCDDSDSGTLNYVSVRYGGFNLSANNEINGLTLGGVGRETEIDYVEIFNNKDDSIEFFGGAVGVKHLILANSGDDSFDYDEGFRGKAQFLFTLQGTPSTDKGDKGFEQDGGNGPDGSQPFAIPTIYNSTIVGLGAQKAYTGRLTNTALHFRDNAGGRHYNSAFLDFGGAAALIEGGSTSSTGSLSSGERAGTAYAVDANYQLGPAGGLQLELQDNEFYCFGAPVADLVPTGKCSVSLVACGSNAACVGGGGDTCVDQAPTYGGDTGKIHFNNGALSNAALRNNYIACGSLPIRQLVRTPVVDPTRPDLLSSIDPIPATGSPLATTVRATPNDGFFHDAPYKGAFAPNNNGNWADGWSTLSRLGYFPARPQVLVSADITTSATWTANNEYVLTDRIYVTGGSTLTIEPGTVVRGETESSVGARDPGTLIITRGSKIDAQGTRDNPIVFTDLVDDNVRCHPGTSPYDNLLDSQTVVGQWGGVILLGYGYVANNTLAGPSTAAEVQIEGLTTVGAEKGVYGGCQEFLVGPYGRNCDDGDSGIMTYVSVRHGGFNLSSNNEINGITLGGVGRSTTLDYLEVFSTKDDFVENFGGSSYMKHVIGVVGGDDGFDYDEGYRGNLQFFFQVQGTPGSDKGDKAFEQDGGNGPDGSQPYAIPTIYNSTVVGLGNNKAYTGKNTNTAMHFRDNAGGRHYNSAFLDFGGAAALIEGGSASCQAALTSGERAVTAYAVDPAYQVGPAGGNQLDLQDNVFYCIGAPVADVVPTGRCTVSLVTCCSAADCVGGGGDACADQGPTYGGDASKIHSNNGAFTNASLDNTLIACGGALPIGTLQRSPSGNAAIPDSVVVIDPRPVAGSPLATTNRQSPGGFFMPANYKGAFEPGKNWAKGWSTIDRSGLFQTCVNGVGAVPDEVGKISFLASKTDLVWSGFVNDAANYDVIRANGPNAFGAAVCVETNGSDDDTFDPAIPAADAGFYYLVRANNACGQGSLGRQSSGVERTGVSCP